MCYTILSFLFGSANSGIDRAALWTGLSALFTGITAAVAIVAIRIALNELKSTQETTRADFAKRFVDSFFCTETRVFFTLLMNSALKFEVMDILDQSQKKIDYLPIFRINKHIAHQLRGVIGFNPDKDGYSAFDVDDLLLGHFEDIAWYERRKLIDINAIHSTFGYYITASFKNEEIQKYLNYKDNEGKYGDFRRLAEQLRQMD
jgi:hypothetical protein